ncbi:MAG: adenylosuccinate lyase [Candidatus Hodarchaeales archaeon]|jgi:adenylosuccinate lyase
MIHPIEGRYRTEVADIFEEEMKLQKMLEIEVSLAKALSKSGFITHEEFEKISFGKEKISFKTVKTIEKETHHDVMAMVQALTNVSCDKVHIGVTSNDIKDTALALQLKDANTIILRELKTLISILLTQAKKTKELVCIGRTHGQHAIPMTYGLKFSLWANELYESYQELNQIKFYGKVNGAIGTFASFKEIGINGFKLQTEVLEDLGLSIPLITNQVIPRIYHSKYLFYLISVACVIEKIAKEIRNLQRSEIFELAEPFTSKQTGSSTMPHKRNPYKCENLCSLAKRLRTNILPVLENISLEHERDLTNSANERIIIPETVILTHYLIQQLSFILNGLEFFEENIKNNLLSSQNIYMEKIMMQLIKEGHGRQEAYNRAKLAVEQQDPASYIGLSKEIVEKVLQEIAL